MKRPIASTLFTAAILTVAACGEPAQPTHQTTLESGWVRTPEIDVVSTSGRELIVRGHAAPLGRVVISGAGGLAYAAGADEEGRFELRVPRPTRDTLLSVEARIGQTGFPAPYRLLIGADAVAPIALLTIGAPSRRLDTAPGLDALDTDGRAVFLSGRAPAGTLVVIEGTGRRETSADIDGRWSMVGAGSGDAPLRVAGAAYSPAPGGSTEPDVLQRSGAGWRITWSGPGGGRQSTWFPDRPPTSN